MPINSPLVRRQNSHTISVRPRDHKNSYLYGKCPIVYYKDVNIHLLNVGLTFGHLISTWKLIITTLYSCSHAMALRRTACMRSLTACMMRPLFVRVQNKIFACGNRDGNRSDLTAGLGQELGHASMCDFVGIVFLFLSSVSFPPPLRTCADRAKDATIHDGAHTHTHTHLAYSYLFDSHHVP